MPWSRKKIHTPISAMPRRHQEIHNTSVEYLIELGAERSIEANETLPTQFLHWTILRDRKCPCTELEADASALCGLCHGAGYLPGYVPYGFRKLALLDSGAPKTLAPNVVYDVSSGTSGWSLASTALGGNVIQFDVPLVPNIGHIVAIEASFGSNEGAITFSWQPSSAQNWSEFEYGSVEAFKDSVALSVRAEMTRNSLDDVSPFLLGVTILYQVRTDPTIILNLPRILSTTEVDELGLLPTLESFNVWADKTLKTPNDGDFFQLVHNHAITDLRYKINSKTPLAPHGVSGGWEMILRKIYENEQENRIPFSGGIL